MKKYILIIFTFLIVFSIGCKKFLDVNHSPNSLDANNAKPELLFPAAVENTAAILGSYGLMLGEIWSQHWTSADNAPQYQAEDSYSVTAGDFNYDLGIWRGLYVGSLMDYEQIRKMSLESENWSYYFMATTMQCYVYQILADLWDKIPMSEALQNKPPKYDDGQVVYDSLLARLDFAISHFEDWDDATSQDPGDNDLIFNGNKDNWLAFANTLKLKILLRQRYVNETEIHNNVLELINSGATFLTTDAAFNHFLDEEGRDNYMYSMEWRGGNTNMRASRTLLNYLDSLNHDNRYHYIFYAASNGKFKSMLQGDFRNNFSFPNDNDPPLSSPFVTPTMPFYFMSKAESYFLQAEAQLFVGSKDNSKINYELAIDADIERLKNHVLTDASEYVHEYPEITGADVYGIGQYANFSTSAEDEDLLELIIVQKWVAQANINGLETFFDHNRTGYPREFAHRPGDQEFEDNYEFGWWHISVTGVLPLPDQFPKRLIYTSSEQNKNPENVPEIKPLNTRVWWDVRDYPY